MSVTHITHFCPTCGYSGLHTPAYEHLGPPPWLHPGPPPYSKWYGFPSYTVCECCGFKFGNDDEPGTGSGQSFEEYRREWIASGCPWFDPDMRPEGWTITDQLLGAFIILNEA